MRDFCTRAEIAANRPKSWLLWRVPVVLIVAGLLVSPWLRLYFWALGFTVMGVACLVNVARCGRLHCLVTGPLFLLTALLSVLLGTGILDWPWHWLGLGAVAGTALAYGLEWTWRPSARS